MEVLVLGAAGFIGAHVTERLLKHNHSVTGVDLYSDKLQEFMSHQQLQFHLVDIRDPEFDLEKQVQAADLVIDLIAYANPGLYIKMPLEVFNLNFTENLKIAQACVKFQKRLIQFSTCEVYGRTIASMPDAGLEDPEDPAHATFSEDGSPLILGPIGKHRWIYACAKQLLERVLHAYGYEQNFNYTIIRPFNFIGPKIDYLLSETDGIPRVFSFFMDGLLNGTKMVLVDGGHRRRSYTYIDDAVDCIYRIIENPDGVCDRQIFNIGHPGNEVSIREMAHQMRDIYARKFKQPEIPLPEIVVESGEEFYGAGYEDSDRRIPDITKARTLLNWEPHWGFTEMLEETMDYYVHDYRDTFMKAREEGRFMHDIIQKALREKPQISE